MKCLPGSPAIPCSPYPSGPRDPAGPGGPAGPAAPGIPFMPEVPGRPTNNQIAFVSHTQPFYIYFRIIVNILILLADKEFDPKMSNDPKNDLGHENSGYSLWGWAMKRKGVLL